MSKNKNDNDIDWGSWILTFVLLSVFPPVGIFLLIKQIIGLVKKPSGPITRHPYDIQREAEGAARAQTQTAAQTQKTARAKTAQSAAKKSKKKKSDPRHIPGEVSGKVLSIVGVSVAGLFLFCMLMSLAEILSYGWYSYHWEELLVFSVFIAGGLICLGLGAGKRRKAKRYRKYLSYIGKNKTVSLSALASAMGKWERTVRQDLQDMLDLGIIPGYIDRNTEQLILTEEGIAQPAPEVAPPVAEDENDILREIRAVNDAIPDEVMSRKIDRIGEITGKILDYQRSHPNRSSQLRSFLNYYLPTTLKVLRAYAQLDSQGVEGENITAAKKRIEDMMDQVVYGFEKQLDLLFRDDAMDITSDVEVLENMLRQDGLSGGTPFGSAARASAAAEEAGQACREMEDAKKELDDNDDQGITLQI